MSSMAIAVMTRMIAALLLALAMPALVLAAGTGAQQQWPLPEPAKETDFEPFDPARAELGRLLFYDKILSGNRNIACGTCHHHDHASTDGLSLGVGEGGIGLGPKRRIPQDRAHPDKRVPRNANALFNLGHRDFRVLFHDGRASIADSYGNGFDTPAEEWLPSGLTSLAATQALFPVTSPIEMAGDPEENDVAAARRERIDRVWPILARRVSSVGAYIPMFARAFDDVETAGDITMTHIANALGDFVISEWRSTDSPFDDLLSGNADALNARQTEGMKLFYGKANCAACHAGTLLTDQKFHALAIPPLGPGRTRLFDPMPRDVGRMAETDDLADAYRFRTPSLRNVALTGPWGHNGAFATLEAMIRHHLDPLGSLGKWDRDQVVLPASQGFAQTDFVIWDDSREMARLKSRVDIAPISLSDDEVGALVAFMESLTGKTALAGRLGRPDTVPSGLPVD